MYQKKAMRENKKMDEDLNDVSTMNINWYIPTYGKLPVKAYNKGSRLNFFLHFISKKR